jgi:hypothetical protein
MNAVIRRIQPDEGATLKSVRLAALADSPSAYSSTYAAEATQPNDHWDLRAAVGAAGTKSATFFAVSGEVVVGMVAVELWVTRGNDAALHLYESQGFCRTGEHEALPSDPCKDELRMRRMLS